MDYREHATEAETLMRGVETLQKRMSARIERGLTVSPTDIADHNASMGMGIQAAQVHATLAQAKATEALINSLADLAAMLGLLGQTQKPKPVSDPSERSEYVGD